MKQIQLTINGQVHTLEFGKMWFLKFFGENTGSNPLEIGTMLNDTAKQFDFIVNLILSGLQANHAVNKMPCEFTKESICDYVGGLDEKEASDVITKYIEIITPKEEKKPAGKAAKAGR
jgi:hypothetical protein